MHKKDLQTYSLRYSDAMHMMLYKLIFIIILLYHDLLTVTTYNDFILIKLQSIIVMFINYAAIHKITSSLLYVLHV